MIAFGGDSFVKRTSNPAWLNDRVSVYETIKARRQAELEGKKSTSSIIRCIYIINLIYLVVYCRGIFDFLSNLPVEKSSD